jgi:uroporphyrinogen III methyltransferase/synthase
MGERLVVLTRDAQGNRVWRRQLEAYGAPVYELECVEYGPAPLNNDIESALSRIKQYAWIIFTSPESVTYLLDHAAELGIGPRAFTSAWIATSNIQTADVLKSLGLVVHFMPSRPDAATLARELKRVKSRDHLVLRSSPSAGEPADTLRQRSGRVTDLRLYTAQPLGTPDPGLRQLLVDGDIAQLVFDSSEAIAGFTYRVADPVALAHARRLPAVAIGPGAAATLRHAGFTDVRPVTQATVRSLIAAEATA